MLTSFILSSGLHTHKYIQCAKLLSFPHLAKDICNSLAKKIKKNLNKVEKTVIDDFILYMESI